MVKLTTVLKPCYRTVKIVRARIHRNYYRTKNRLFMIKYPQVTKYLIRETVRKDALSISTAMIAIN